MVLNGIFISSLVEDAGGPRFLWVEVNQAEHQLGQVSATQRDGAALAITAGLSLLPPAPGQPPHSQMFPCPRTSFETPQSGDCLVGTVELTEYRNCGFSLSRDYHPVAWKAQRTRHRPRTRLIFITFSLVLKAKPFFNEQYDS